MAQGFKAEVLDKLSPFKQSKKMFSMYADLTALGETYDGQFDNTVEGKPACDFESVSIFESSYLKRAYALPESRKVFMDTPDLPEYQPEPTSYFVVLAHEFGHAFGNLRDEYDVGRELSFLQRWKFKGRYRGRNCASSESVAQAFPPPGNTLDPARAICGLQGNYRSTINSLMNNHNTQDGRAFNVVSCGYVLQSIKGGDASSYWKECERYGDVYTK